MCGSLPEQHGFVRAHDRGHQVAAECRTCPGNVACLFVDIQACAVCCQTGGKAAGYARAEVTAVVGSADQHAGRAVFLNECDKSLGIGVCGILFIFRTINDDDLIGTMCVGSFDRSVRAGTDDDSDQLAALFLSQHAARGQKFDTDILRGAVFVCFNKYP